MQELLTSRVCLVYVAMPNCLFRKVSSRRKVKHIKRQGTHGEGCFVIHLSHGDVCSSRVHHKHLLSVAEMEFCV